jgi:hypothetical protein
MAYRILTSAALLVALAVPALAADEIRPSGPAISLRVSTGTLLQSPRPLVSVFIANPEIANVDGHVALNQTVEVTGPKTVRVMRGSTSSVWSETQEHAPTLADLPAGSSVTVPAGGGAK